MKNKLMYMFLNLLIISAAINGSDGDSPEERSIVPYLDTRKMEAEIMSAASAAAISMAQIPLTNLHTAAKDNNLNAVTELIASGVDVNSKGPLRMTALTMGTYAKCQLPIIEALIKAGADVNEGSFMGGTPLSNAIEKGYVEHVRVLLAAHANPNYRAMGESVLEMAINRNQLEIAKMLIAAGASVNTQLLRRAIYEDNLDMVKLLVSAGANVNDTNRSYSVLSEVNKKNQKMIDYLESKGAVRFWGESCSIQ